MAEQEKTGDRRRDKEEHAEEVDVVVESDTDLEALDDLLDEIDEVLEENAEEFVKNYVQKGGE
jgi:ubiquitin-like protein Pup